MAGYAFHPEALLEYANATNFYLREASPAVAERFVAAVERAIAYIVADPVRCRVVEAPSIRRFVFRRFPYVLFYQWEPDWGSVIIYAIMHCSREPGYWKKRVT